MKLVHKQGGLSRHAEIFIYRIVRSDRLSCNLESDTLVEFGEQSLQ